MNRRSTLIFGAAALSGAIAIAVIVKKRVLRGSGYAVTQERSVDAFKSVRVNGLSGLHYVSQADKPSIQVTADDNLADMVKTTVADGVLTLKMETGGKFVLPKGAIEVHVAGPGIDHLHVEGKGKLRVGALDADQLTMDLNGMGDIKGGPIHAQRLTVDVNGIGECELSGLVEEQQVNLNGIVKYRAVELDSRKTRLEINGIMDVDVRVRDDLTVEMDGKCKVRYYGNPQVTSNARRPGMVIQAPMTKDTPAAQVDEPQAAVS